MTIHKVTALECNRCHKREENLKAQDAWTTLQLRMYGKDRHAHLCVKCSDALLSFMLLRSEVAL